MKTIAIVILNWNGEKLLRQLLPTVIKNSQHPSVRVIVADNASTDGSIEYLNTNHPTIQTIELTTNHGFAGGYNRALLHVEADYYLLLNSDVAPDVNWLVPLFESIEKFPDTAAMMPKIRSYNQPSMFEYAGAAGGYIDKYGFPFCRGRLFNITEQDNNQYQQVSEIFWASGAAFLIKSNLYKQTGGFDESFFAHMEEIDLCWRLKNLGHSIKFIPESIVYHIGGASLHQSHPKKTYLNFRNNLYLLTKNLPKNKVISILLMRMILDGLAVIKFMISLDIAFAFAVLKAHFSFYNHLPQLLKQRKVLIQTQKAQIHKEIYPRSIVFDFYIKRIKHFSELKFDL